MSHDDESSPEGCSSHCRKMADANYRLANTPDIIANYLDLAFEYTRCADTSDRIAAAPKSNVVAFPARRKSGR